MFLTTPWYVKETNTSTTATEPNLTTPIHRQGSPTLSLPRPVHWKIVDKVWAKIQREKLPLIMKVGDARRVDDLVDAPPLLLSPSPYENEIAGFPKESMACGDHQSLQESGGRMEMPDFAMERVKGESLVFISTSTTDPTVGLGPCNREGMECERGGRGKKRMNEASEKEEERRMKRLIRTRESSARFHAKKRVLMAFLISNFNHFFLNYY